MKILNPGEQLIESEYKPLLPGIGFCGYRSFATWQTFTLATKVTVLAGINNCGKSNVLRFLEDVLPKLRVNPGIANPNPLQLGELDRPRGFAGVPPLEVGLPVRIGTFGEPKDPTRLQGVANSKSRDELQEAVMSLLCNDDEIFWARYTLADNRFSPNRSNVDKAISSWPSWENSYRSILTTIGGGDTNPTDVMSRLLAPIGDFSSIPNVVTIKNARQIEATNEEIPDWSSGRGVIRALAELQSPTHGKWEDSKLRWAAINRFIRIVLGDSGTSLSIPHDFSTIQIETPQRVLPLSSLGSGVEQVIVLAAAATVATNSLVCIEEPETNLHPLLQKKLVRYLTDETDNQYVIATHSSHLLDDARATAYHIRLTTEGSVSRLARQKHELIEICQDLGYRPSDLLQANCIIWAEGPSDRTYIRRWLELYDAKLSEGIDYSIMFYGGKLLAHLTASEEALEDFISLRQLNRASMVLIDSDKTGPKQRINATKKRIRDEFDKDHPAPGFAWVTKCYTVENYIPGEILKSAVEATHPSVSYQIAGQWENPLPSTKEGRKFDKVGIANTVASMLKRNHLNILDLRAQLAGLSKFVRAANGHSITPEEVQ
ncbi:AAA family ATPase [Crossiella sp. CA198]|uniref:AAA family ATPase n=1 Tax=Crossiella sp. CA198 TaxID=3455607 RepID=UPI003F8D06DE